jgi:hypothetical protein
MALEYPGVFESWVSDFSIHGPGHGVAGARLWVGDTTDTGGILMRAENGPTTAWGEIATQRFAGTGHGPLRLRTVNDDDWVEVWSGTAESASRQVMLGTVGPSSAAGIKFGPAGDVGLFRSMANTLKTDGKLIAEGGLGVGNSMLATSPGRVTRKIEVFDATGRSLGYVPVYDAID